jgi:heme-degrading monooxygenase HmoA
VRAAGARGGAEVTTRNQHFAEIADCLDEAHRLQSRVIDLTEEVYQAAGMSTVDRALRGKPAFDAHGATRKASGSKGGRLLRSAEDPNELVILLEWDNLQKARQFAQSDDLRNTMQRAGVVGKPEVSFLEELEGPTAQVPAGRTEL